MRKFEKNDEAFTGLEAAIVLIAFVVVAAVFSYMMLGAGFFTSQKSQEVVHTATEQTSSSVDIAGAVVAAGSSTTDNVLDSVSFYLQLTSGGTSVDLSKTAYAVTTSDGFEMLTPETAATGTKDVKYEWETGYGDGDNLLESGELVKVTVPLYSGDVTVSPKESFTIDVKPSVGAALSLTRTAPTHIENGKYYEVY